MANIPEEVGTQSTAQLTHVITDGVRVSVPRVIAYGGDSFGSQMESVSQGLGSGLMANDVSESVLQGVVNGVGVDGIRGNGVSEGMINGGSGLMANGVSESVPQGVVNVVRVNGVRSNGVREGMINGARASGVRRSFREFVSEFLADGSSSSVGQDADAFATKIDKDHLLACFNHEVHEDLARLRVYRYLANGLRVVEQMQLDDVEKGIHALLMMKETEAKIGEKARFILNLRGVAVE
uniref:Uncharacterized protein n=1 Tax=Tanacetum cinerariifolium TaxID=118510 RepID=A0A6L2JDU8_TANCI|nr:hypothetical protein [Tanacetum cinerariifolium]